MLRRTLFLSLGLFSSFIVHADAEAQSVTGIPVEVLFLALGALVAVIYWDLRRSNKQQNQALAQITRLAEERGRQIESIARVLMQVCGKMNLPIPRSWERFQ